MATSYFLSSCPVQALEANHQTFQLFLILPCDSYFEIWTTVYIYWSACDEMTRMVMNVIQS